MPVGYSHGEGRSPTPDARYVPALLYVDEEEEITVSVQPSGELMDDTGSRRQSSAAVLSELISDYLTNYRYWCGLDTKRERDTALRTHFLRLQNQTSRTDLGFGKITLEGSGDRIKLSWSIEDVESMLGQIFRFIDPDGIPLSIPAPLQITLRRMQTAKHRAFVQGTLHADAGWMMPDTEEDLQRSLILAVEQAIIASFGDTLGKPLDDDTRQKIFRSATKDATESVFIGLFQEWAQQWAGA